MPEWICVSLTNLTLQSCDVTVLDARGRGQALSVLVDSLRPDMDKKAEQQRQKKQKALHPALQPAGCPLPILDLGNAGMVKLAELCISQEHLAALQCAQEVTVTWQSAPTAQGHPKYPGQVRGEGANANAGKEDKGPAFPVVLQVRSNRSFRRGELVLVPAGAEVWEKGERGTELERKRARGTELAIQKSKAVHSAMLASVEAQVDCGPPPKKRRKFAQASSQEEAEDVHLSFDILSPLVTAAKAPAQRKRVLESLLPFWALLQRAQAGGPANMALEYLRVTPKASDVDGWPLECERAQRLHYVVRVPIATNTSRINKGDVLTLPFETGSVKVNTGDVEVAQQEGKTRTGTEVR